MIPPLSSHGVFYPPNSLQNPWFYPSNDQPGPYGSYPRVLEPQIYPTTKATENSESSPLNLALSSPDKRPQQERVDHEPEAPIPDTSTVLPWILNRLDTMA